MILLIAGSRGIDDLGMLTTVLELTIPTPQVEVLINGMAEEGVDKTARDWRDYEWNHNQHFIDFEQYPAEWQDISQPDAIVRYRSDGTPYDKKAGIRRNKQMAERLEALRRKGNQVGAVCLWDGASPGTHHMMQQCILLRVPVVQAIWRDPYLEIDSSLYDGRRPFFLRRKVIDKYAHQWFYMGRAERTPLSAKPELPAASGMSINADHPMFEDSSYQRERRARYEETKRKGGG